MTLQESDLTERLDEQGLLPTAHRPGVYCVELSEPSDDVDTLRGLWELEYDADPPPGFLDRLANAERLVYVGSHGQNMYERICQHIRGHQSSTIMAIWPPESVVDLHPCDHPRDHEWGYASDISDGETVVWTDGEYI